MTSHGGKTIVTTKEMPPIRVNEDVMTQFTVVLRPPTGLSFEEHYGDAAHDSHLEVSREKFTLLIMDSQISSIPPLPEPSPCLIRWECCWMVRAWKQG